MPQQFVNQANPDAHYRTTAVEMCEQLGQKIDIYVSGVGSGGTLQGIAKYLLEKNPDTKIVAVEPKGVSAVFCQQEFLKIRRKIPCFQKRNSLLSEGHYWLFKVSLRGLMALP